jgi:hypothetical protein
MDERVMDEDEAPNKHGALLTFVDDFEEWRWEHENQVTDISARAVRQFLRELSDSCSFVIYPSDEGGRVVLTALHGDFHIETDLRDLLRDFAGNDGWQAEEKAAFRRVLQNVINSMEERTP